MWEVSISHYFGQVTHIAQCRGIIWVMAYDRSLSHGGAHVSNLWGVPF